MNLLKKDEEKGHFKLRIEDMDDLWYLYQVLRPGQIIGSHTYRKLEARDDTLRPDSQPRVKVYLKIEVENTEFHPFTDDLRVGGTISSGPEDMSGHHTFNLEPGKTIDILIPSITKEDIDLIKDSIDTSGRYKALAISIDDESGQIFRIRDYGVEQIASLRVKAGGKQFNGAGGWDAFYKEIGEALKHNLSDDFPLLLIGPGFFKESLAKVLREGYSIDQSRIHILNASSGGLRGLNEALSTGKGLTGAIQNLRYQKETSSVSRLMEAIGKGMGGTYGMTEVKGALDLGAVEVLMVTETIFRSDEGRDLMSAATKMGSKSMIISVSHEAGQMLDKLGGVGAILRFEID